MAQTDTHTNGHGDSMTELAQWGQFSDNKNVKQKGFYKTCFKRVD